VLYVCATDDGASARIIRVVDGPHGLRPARTARSERPGELCEQGPDAGVDLVADGSDVVGGPVGRVGQLPVQVALAGVDGAGVAAAHGDHDVGGADGVVGEGLGELFRQVQPDLGHHLVDGGVDPVGGCGAGGADADAAPGVVVEQGGGHL